MSLSTHDIRPVTAAPDGAVKPRTVVVGYDGSDEARAAFAVAIDRAPPSDRIVLVHATAPASNWLGSDVGAAELDDLAHQAADDALIAILRKLDEFGGTSRFSTWASKFALHETGVKGRQRAWQNRKLGLDTQAWRQIGAADGLSTQVVLEDRETLGVLRDSIRLDLTPHQREVLTALAINGIPIDVLAERCDTTRGALYKTLHDARRKLRLALVVAGQAEVTPLE